MKNELNVKKDYVAPQMRSVKLKYHAFLLNGSPDSPLYNGGLGWHEESAENKQV